LLEGEAITLLAAKKNALRERLARLATVPGNHKTLRSRWAAEDRLRELEAQERLPSVLKPVSACPWCHHEQAVCCGTVVYMDGRKEEINICRSCASAFNSAYSAIVNTETLPASVNEYKQDVKPVNISTSRSATASAKVTLNNYWNERRAEKANAHSLAVKTQVCLVCNEEKMMASPMRVNHGLICSECREKIINTYGEFVKRGWNTEQIAKWYKVSPTTVRKMRWVYLSRLERGVYKEVVK
jgi:transcription elongation factor Elf1